MQLLESEERKYHCTILFQSLVCAKHMDGSDVHRSSCLLCWDIFITGVISITTCNASFSFMGSSDPFMEVFMSWSALRRSYYWLFIMGLKNTVRSLHPFIDFIHQRKTQKRLCTRLAGTGSSFLSGSMTVKGELQCPLCGWHMLENGGAFHTWNLLRVSELQQLSLLLNQYSYELMNIIFLVSQI